MRRVSFGSGDNDWSDERGDVRKPYGQNERLEEGAHTMYHDRATKAVHVLADSSLEVVEYRLLDLSRFGKDQYLPPLRVLNRHWIAVVLEMSHPVVKERVRFVGQEERIVGRWQGGIDVRFSSEYGLVVFNMLIGSK